MSLVAAEWLANLLLAYFGWGVVFAVTIVVAALPRLDPDTRAAPWGFRLLLIPGATLLWPLLAWRLLRRAGPPRERNPHLDAADPSDSP